MIVRVGLKFFPFTYEAGAKQNEIKLHSSARSTPACRYGQYPVYIYIYMYLCIYLFIYLCAAASTTCMTLSAPFSRIGRASRETPVHHATWTESWNAPKLCCLTRSWPNLQVETAADSRKLIQQDRCQRRALIANDSGDTSTTSSLSSSSDSIKSRALV